MKSLKITLAALAALAVSSVLSGCDSQASVDAITCDNPQIVSKATENLAKPAWDALNDKQKSFFKNYDDFVQQNHITLTFKNERKADNSIPGEYDGLDRKFCVFSYQASPVMLKGKKVDDEFTAKLSKADDGSAFIVANPREMKFAKNVDAQPTSEQSAYDDFLYDDKRKQEAQQQSEHTDKVEAYRKVPLTDYHYLTTEQLTLAYVAHNPQLSDDEKMTLLSEKYRNTRDQFTRRDLIASELPHLLEQTAQYKETRYIKYVVSDMSQRPAAVPADAVYIQAYHDPSDSPFYTPGEYDFDKHLFTVKTGMGCEPQSNMRYRGFGLTGFSNAYNVIVPQKDVLLNCTSTPASETQARAWSSVFSANSVDNRYQVMYVVLDNWTPYQENGFEQKNVRGFLTHVEFHYLNQQGKDQITGVID